MRDLAMWHWAWRRAWSSSRDKHMIMIIITCHVSQTTISLSFSLFFLTQLTLFLWELCTDLPSIGHLHNRNLEPAACTYMSNGTHTLRWGEQLPECARPILALSIRTRQILLCWGVLGLLCNLRLVSEAIPMRYRPTERIMILYLLVTCQAHSRRSTTFTYESIGITLIASPTWLVYDALVIFRNITHTNL